MLKFFFIKVCFLLIILTANFSQAISSNHILAIVNGTNIYSSDIETRKKILKLLDPNFKINIKDLDRNILDQLIDELLIIEETKNYKFHINKEDVLEQIHYFESLNKWNKNEIYKKIIPLNLAKEDIDSYFLNQLTIQQFIQGISFNKIQINNDELNKEYYNLLNLNGKFQYLVSEIYISTNNKSKKLAEQHINEIYYTLQKGGNFNLIVSTYSDNLYSKNSGGIVGWLYETQIPTLEKQVLDSLEINGISKPVFLENGYYIFKLLDKKLIIYLDPNDAESTSKIKEMLREKIFAEKSQKYVNNYISNLRCRAVINYYNKL